ncbi:MAG: sensor histidine kinase, partial [Elusimicrobia bacterium]|nr:sensor histidine kinase [Elusimicrobiota bacterium]
VVMASLKRSFLEASLREQREAARRISDRVAAHVWDIRNVLLTVASREGSYAGPASALSTARKDDAAIPEGSKPRVALRQLLENYPALMEASIIGPRGRETAKLVRRGERIVVSSNYVHRGSRPEFRRPQQGRSYIGPVFFTERERLPQMFISVPLDARREQVLLARVSLGNIWDLVSAATVGKSGYAYIVDSKGALIAHPETGRVFAHENLAESPAVKEFLQNPRDPDGDAAGHTFRFQDEKGEPVLAVHHRVPELDWEVIVQIPLRDALSPLRTLWRQVAVVVIVLGSVFLTVGLSLVQRILRPLSHLQEGVQKIGQGNLAHRLDVRTDDEIQKLAEEFNAMAESLERLEQAKRDLTHMIVHDLKNPLSSVLGSIDYILTRAEALTPEQKKILSLGSKSGKDLIRLIQNLLDFAKMEEGRLELRRENFSLLEMAADCVDDLEAHIHRESKMVSVEVPKDLPKAWADRDLLHRVLSNLLTNSLKHTSQGAEISIRANLDAEQKALVLSVKDNGEGIPEQFRQKIFEKFGQAEAKKQRFRIGAGLGLAFCKMAVEAHGGRIWVESEEGKGSEFFVQIPLEIPGKLM